MTINTNELSSSAQDALQETLPQEKLIAQETNSRLPTKTEEIRKMATEGFLEYCVAIDKKYQDSWFHEVLTGILQNAYERVKRGENVRIILEVPPRHGKSETSTIKFPSWVLGKDPEYPFIICSYSADLAEDFGQKTRDTINLNKYKMIFPDVKLSEDTTARGKWKTSVPDKHGFWNNTEGGYTATGVGGAITGKGFKIGIVDDPFKNREEAESETIRERVWNWWKSTFYTREEGNTAIIVIMTRWHTDDLVGRLLEQQKKFEEAGIPKGQYDDWELIRFPAIAEEDEKYRKKGEALWPARFPVKELYRKRNSMDVYDWSALYQQSPILSVDAEFKKEWFKYFEEDDLKGKNLIYTTTVDLAISQKKTADNSVIRTVGKETDKPNWYLIDEVAGRLDPLEVIDALFWQYQKYRSKVWIESVAYQAALRYFIEEEMRKKQVYFLVNELTRRSTLSKEARIRGLIPLYRAGVIYHRKSDVELERELLQFPKGKHDDRPDALSMQLEVIMNTRKKHVEEKEEPFDRFSFFR